MVLPTFGELRIHLLKLLQDQSPHNLSEVKDSIARKLDVSESERKKMSIKKGRPIYDSRIIHTLSVLRKQGLLTNERRGVFKITRSGFSESKKF